MSELLPDPNTRIDRRRAFKIGGLTVSLAAIVAACGDDRGGDTAPGRVGYAPPITDPPDYDVDDAVLLRTASSLQNTAIAVYTAALGLGLDGIDPATQTLFEQLIENHEGVAGQMAELTTAAGGEVWECTNPWLEERLIEPVLNVIQASDNPARDVYNFAVALENLAASTHQALAVALGAPEAKIATLEAATLSSRQSAAIVIAVRGEEGYLSPELDGLGIPTDADGIPERYAVESRFGSVAQAQLTIGAPNDVGVRQTFLLQPPAENSYVYNELEPIC